MEKDGDFCVTRFAEWNIIYDSFHVGSKFPTGF